MYKSIICNLLLTCLIKIKNFKWLFFAECLAKTMNKNSTKIKSEWKEKLVSYFLAVSSRNLEKYLSIYVERGIFK